MSTLIHASAFTGYVYPNETVIPWTALIVIYPYLTGLAAGAFTVSSFYHVFGIERFRPVARLALLTALAVMIIVPAPLLLHLGHPERAMNAMITAHFTSAFAMFGFFAAFYVVLLLLENYFVYRVDNVARAHASKGLARFFYRATTLWSDDTTERARGWDRRLMFALAAIGIPAAHGLHGYVGFVFGSLKSREWWGSDLMPVIFLFSAIISGVALLVVIYVVSSLIRRVKIDQVCILGLAQALWGFVMFTVLLEGVEFASLIYKSREGIEIIIAYVNGPMFTRFVVLQFGLGAGIPIVILGTLVLGRVRGNALIWGAFLSAILVLGSVLLMRWNVVIGGQEIAKTMRGLLSYQPQWGGREGLLAAAGVLIAPFMLLYLLVRLFPPWNDRPTAPDEVSADHSVTPVRPSKWVGGTSNEQSATEVHP